MRPARQPPAWRAMRPASCPSGAHAISALLSYAGLQRLSVILKLKDTHVSSLCPVIAQALSHDIILHAGAQHAVGTQSLEGMTDGRQASSWAVMGPGMRKAALLALACSLPQALGAGRSEGVLRPCSHLCNAQLDHTAFHNSLRSPLLDCSGGTSGYPQQHQQLAGPAVDRLALSSRAPVQLRLDWRVL